MRAHVHDIHQCVVYSHSCIVLAILIHQHSYPPSLLKRCQHGSQCLCAMRSQSGPSLSLHFPESKHADLTSSSPNLSVFCAQCHRLVFTMCLKSMEEYVMLLARNPMGLEAEHFTSPHFSLASASSCMFLTWSLCFAGL